MKIKQQKIIRNMLYLILAIFTITFILTVITMWSTNTCKTYAYYLPMTFIIYNLTEERL